MALKTGCQTGGFKPKFLESAYKHCVKLEKVKYKQIKSYQMQDCIDSCGCGYSTQGAIKNLFGHLDRFAMELDIISKCCSDLLTSAPIPETTKEIFTDEKVARIWDNQKLEWADSVLFFLYAGFRISEMIDLKTETILLPAGDSVRKLHQMTGTPRNEVTPGRDISVFLFLNTRRGGDTSATMGFSPITNFELLHLILMICINRPSQYVFHRNEMRAHQRYLIPKLLS